MENIREADSSSQAPPQRQWQHLEITTKPFSKADLVFHIKCSGDIFCLKDWNYITFFESVEKYANVVWHRQ